MMGGETEFGVRFRVRMKGSFCPAGLYLERRHMDLS